MSDNQEKWYFSVQDMVKVLSQSKDVKQFIYTNFANLIKILFNIYLRILKSILKYYDIIVKNLNGIL